MHAQLSAHITATLPAYNGTAQPLMTRYQPKQDTLDYTVAPGDSLTGIAQKDCGQAADWTGTYNANKKTIGTNPDQIEPGQKLVLDCAVETVAAYQRPESDWFHRNHLNHIVQEAQRNLPLPVAVAVSAPAADPPQAPHYACGDGDGDGFDKPCTSAPVTTHVQGTAVRAAPVSSGNVSTAGMGGYQACVIRRESGGNAGAVNAASGAGGLYQFLPSTWASLGYSGLPQNAPVSVQNAAFQKLYAQAGTSPWSPSDGC